MGLGVKSLTLVLAFALGLPVAAGAARRRARGPVVVTPAAHVIGVRREEILELPIGDVAGPADARALPGALGIEIHLATSPARVATALDALAPPWRVHTRATEAGVRIRIAHPQPGVSFAATRTESTLRIAFGVADEQTRLRGLGDALRAPLPEPDDLGSELEVWQDAERSTLAGELPAAKRLWERLAETPRLADLAALRVAELFVVSGHINEALSQLRDVPRRHPRAAGAALARLDILHLEALTGLGTPTVAQVDIAAGVIDRAGFETFAAIRAAMALRDMGLPSAALARLPDAATAPASWREATEALRQDLSARTLLHPFLLGDPQATAIQWTRWSDRVGDLTAHDEITDVVAEALEQLGLHDQALPLVQARLRTGPPSAIEADLVGRVAHAYRILGDIDRATFAVEFQLDAHAQAPGLADDVAAIAVRRCERDGLASARQWLATARKRTTSAAVTRAIDAIDVDLVLGWGTPAQIVHRLGRDDGAQPTMSDPTLHHDPERDARDARALAVALVRVGRHAAGAEMLRRLAGGTADPAERDRLSYYLGVAEQALGHAADADRIFAHISTHGTTFGQLAIARLQEQRLATAVKALSAPPPGAVP